MVGHTGCIRTPSASTMIEELDKENVGKKFDQTHRRGSELQFLLTQVLLQP